MLALILLRPNRGMKGGDVFSKLVVLRKRLQAIRFCTLVLFSDYPIDLDQALPSTISPPYVSTRALSNVAQSRTSLSNPPLGTQRGDRNQVGENEHGLGGASLVDTTYCKSCTRTAATVDMAQPDVVDRA